MSNYLFVPKKFITSNTAKDDNSINQFLSWMLVLKDIIALFEKINAIKNQIFSEPSIYILQLKIAQIQEERIKFSRIYLKLIGSRS